MTPAALLAAWDDLKWRHHGTGMLQAYINDACRVHIWRPELLRPGMTISGAMHDHRFSFRSNVLVGSILHTDLDVHPASFGPHQLWLCPLEGAAGRECGLEPSERVQMCMGTDDVLSRGTTYEIEKRSFHWARPNGELAVTVVEMFDKDRSARSRVIAPYGAPPVHAFDFDPDEALIAKTLTAAYCALQEVT